MPEYFELSFICPCNSVDVANNVRFFRQFGDHGNLIMSRYFGSKSLLWETYEHNRMGFTQFLISIPDFTFTKSEFSLELQLLEDFIVYMCTSLDNIELVLCSYELNMYLLDGMNSIADLKANLSEFPLVFIWNEMSKSIIRKLNLSAQQLY